MIGVFIILALGLLSLLILHLSKSTTTINSQDNTLSEKVDAIDSLLPQTQCGKCNYTGCRPYAEAIATGRADIYQCPPGGEATVQAIAQLMGQETRPSARAMEQENVQTVALIDEDLCIGCVKCIKACPVDAIIGARGFMHTVIKKYCTGCELCIPACPVDCISMVPLRIKTTQWVWSKPDPYRKPAA